MADVLRRVRQRLRQSTRRIAVPVGRAHQCCSKWRCVAEGGHQPQFAQVSSGCQLDDWFHARRRRSCPLRRWLVDDAAAARAARNGHRLGPIAMLVGHQPFAGLLRGRNFVHRCVKIPVRVVAQSLNSQRSSNSASATSIDGSGPPRSRAARRRAATNRSSESMVSMSRARGDVRAAGVRKSAPRRPQNRRPLSSRSSR